jgi:hypothetical protein
LKPLEAKMSLMELVNVTSDVVGFVGNFAGLILVIVTAAALTKRRGGGGNPNDGDEAMREDTPI